MTFTIVYGVFVLLNTFLFRTKNEIQSRLKAISLIFFCVLNVFLVTNLAVGLKTTLKEDVAAGNYSRINPFSDQSYEQSLNYKSFDLRKTDAEYKKQVLYTSSSGMFLSSMLWAFFISASDDGEKAFKAKRKTGPATESTVSFSPMTNMIFISAALLTLISVRCFIFMEILSITHILN